MESRSLQGKKYAALKGKSLYLILGGFCLLFITSFFFFFFSSSSVQYFLGSNISQALQHRCEMGNKPIYIL